MSRRLPEKHSPTASEPKMLFPGQRASQLHAEASTSGRESPLLPMGYERDTKYQVDPDKLSDQLSRIQSRYSQSSIMFKNYALADDGEETPECARKTNPDRRKSKILPRGKSYRISTQQGTTTRHEISSKFKSACRKLKPKRLARKSDDESIGDRAFSSVPMDNILLQ